MKYYLDENSGLWKKDGVDHYYFSRKSLKWVKSKIFFILPYWDYKNTITEEKAKEVLADYKAAGKCEDEIAPMRYFANDNYDIFVAIDIYGKEYFVLADMSLMPVKNTINCDGWESFDKEDIEPFVEKLYQKDEWILLSHGMRWERCIDDYIGIIEKAENGYKAEIRLDDGIDYPYAVAYLDAKDIEELKQETELEMQKRAKLRAE